MNIKWNQHTVNDFQLAKDESFNFKAASVVIQF